MCLFALAFTNRYVPESKGRRFEEIDAEVRDRWGAGARQPTGAYR